MRFVSWMRVSAFVAVAAFVSPSLAQGPLEEQAAEQRQLADYSAAEIEQLAAVFVADPSSLSTDLPARSGVGPGRPSDHADDH